MEIGDLPAYFIQEVKDYSAQAHYERNAFRLSELLGVRIRPGRYTSIIPGPPPTIILEPQLLGLRDSDHVRHELGQQGQQGRFTHGEPRWGDKLRHDKQSCSFAAVWRGCDRGNR